VKLSLFLLFWRQIISDRNPELRRKPESWTGRDTKERQNARCSFAVFRCFLDSKAQARSAQNRTIARRGLEPPIDRSTRLNDITKIALCQFNNYDT
jgi:hypothetical protein